MPWRFGNAVAHLVTSTNSCHLHTQQAAKFFNLRRDVPDAHRAMVRRAVRVPVVHKLPRADAEAVSAVGVADFQNRAGY